jgi:uncharacterized protein YukE
MKEIERIANNIDTNIKEYQSTYLAINNLVNTMDRSWKGKDNLTYIKKVNSYNKDFTQLTKTLSQYTKCIRECTKAYAQTQQRLIERAKYLSKQK